MLASDPRPSRQPAATRAKQTRYRYGIEPEEFQALVEKQGGRCAICGEVPARLHVDHDHGCCLGDRTCGECIRGLLCGVYNRSLGGFKDNILALQSAIDYLRRWKDAS